MATATEFVANEYLVFEADQVLTNDHLNQLFNYLDQQNRWTRNKLIGIGIACGLHLTQHTGVIEVGKGCGITSQGYLIIQPTAKQYTYYTPYAGIDQPKDLSFTYPGNLPFYKPFITGKTIFSLLTDDEYAVLETDAKNSAQTISSANANNMLVDYAVVLFAEAGEQDLKNCDTFDCNNKGEKMTVNLRALLVKKTDLPSARRTLLVFPVRTATTLNTSSLRSISAATSLPQNETGLPPDDVRNFATGDTTSSSSNIISPIAFDKLINPDILIRPLPITIFPTRFPEIPLKRFNVPYTDLKSTDDVINAFTSLVDDGTLAAVASAFNYCYAHYKDVLDDAAAGFTTLFADLKAQRDLILQKNPVFIQYFYDFVDDLVKAYYEFRSKVSLLSSVCCPDENMFPLHLVLGAATANTRDFTKDSYRTYFIYSPLFARQESEISETQFLYRRMQILASEFTMIAPDDISTAAVKILPSYYQKAALSQRAIPYYYSVNEDGNELYKYWNYSKTVRSEETLNLSYNADAYSSSSAVLNPLLYDIEKNDFFRIEGHIGTNFQSALTNILQQKKTYNLPFDVVAVSADQLTNTSLSLPQCNVQDLDTDFKLMISEFACKVHIPFCFITKMTNPPTTVTGSTGIGGIFTGGIFTGGIFTRNIASLNLASAETSAAEVASPLSFSAFKLQNAITDKILINPGIFRLGYRKGDFMRKYCPPADKVVTIGSVYLASVKNGVFTNPVPLLTQSGTNVYYYQLFQYVDAVESLMQVLMPATLTTLDMDAFSDAYQRFADSLYQVTVAAAEINNNKTGTTDAAAQQFLKDIETDMLVNELSAPVYDCIDERLQTLISEYASRLQQYQDGLNFLSYYSKHPGLEHKGGVPKGGTFVLVYRPAAPAATASGTTSGTTVNTGGIVGTTPATGNTGIVPNIGGIRNTGIINSGILKTGILKTSVVKNPVITGARLFMAKAPKRTPEKAAKKTGKAAAKKEAGTGIKSKDLPLRGGSVLTAGTVNPVIIKTASVPTRTGAPAAGTTVTHPTIPIVQPTATTVQPTAATVQPTVASVQPATAATQPIAAALHPVTEATQPVASTVTPEILTAQPAVSLHNPLAEQPANVATRPNPVAFDSDQPLITATKPFKPVIITTRPSQPATTVSTRPILVQPGTIPITTHFPIDINPTASQPQPAANPSSMLDQNTINLINNFANASADLSSDNKKTILDFLNQAKQQLAASKFNIADNVVIADFYVPYLCCSDCAPVAYIVQQPAPTPPQEEPPSFDITPKEFLFDDEGKYPFTMTPPVSDANKAADPFASDTLINPGSLHLLTDDKNVLFLAPAMPNLTATTTATVAYHNLPVDITIIKPDASFSLDAGTDKDGDAALQVTPVDMNADSYKWTVNGIDGIFENSKAPAAVKIDDIRNKAQTSPFTIALTVTYTRNNKTSADTQQQVYQPSVCIDFDAFEANTFFGARADQKEGDLAFSTTEKIEASVLPLRFSGDKAFGSAFISKALRNFGDGQCLQMDTMALQFDYTKSNMKPEQITVEFLVAAGIINLAVNGSDLYMGDVGKLPKQFKDVKVSVEKTDDGSAMLVMKGKIETFIIGGQQFFIDNVCAQ